MGIIEDPFTWISPWAAVKQSMSAVGVIATAVPLPSGKETTLAGPHVEHPRSETHIEFFVGLELARLVRKLQ